jgi:ABC-2 type transport system ATP-binding protein
MDDIAIKIDHVSKDFKLPHEKVGSVKSIFLNLFKYIRKSRSFENQHALHDVSLEIKKGEFFGIVGRNGSGKSTLLKMLAGIYQPTEGKIHVEGKLVPFIELGVGFSPELTGRQNVYLNGALLGFSEKEINEQYEDIVEFAELEKFMDQKLKNYSSGMQVRLAFSMAVRAKADVLLIDEVLAVGDADFQRKCYEYFKKLKKDKKTVVFVSHDMGAVQEYCDRVALIDKNRLKKIGMPNDIAEDYFKLFVNKEQLRSKSGEKEERWGDKRAEIVNFSVKTDETSVVVAYDIVANDNLDEVVAGFRIRSSDGKDVTGTNTKKEKHRLSPMKKNEKISLSWSLPNIFSDGEYYVDPALVYFDEITVYDWWDEAGTFSVNKHRGLPFLIDPGFKLEINSR